MSQIVLNWELFEERIDSVERYCSGCGNKVMFYDSMVRRHNANGKKIYKYAIYKCERGHTWNKIINKYLSNKYNTLSNPDSLESNGYAKEEQYKKEGDKKIKVEKFSVLKYKKENVNRVDILIECEDYKIRLDKLLNENLIDISRTLIQKKIKDEQILVNDIKTKSKYTLKHGDKITIFI